MPIREILGALLANRPLSADEAASFFSDLLEGRLDDSQIGAALALMQSRGPSVDELVGGATIMRRHVTTIPMPATTTGAVLDTCGTGGAPKTFNISTLAAIVAAAAAPGRVRVAKHGNRSRSGRGSAEVLAALGVNIDAPPAVQARCLAEVGVCFCFAIHHHPAMKHAAGARRSLGFPTIFNLLGPLTNPAGATRQLLGIYDVSLVERMAHALARLGAERAMVVHGSDGMDEITTTGTTRVALVERGSVTLRDFSPGEAGVTVAQLPSLTCATLDEAVAAAKGVLAGEPGPKRDIVALNSGAALFVAGVVASIEEGIGIAHAAITNGQAAATLGRLAAVSQG